MTKELEETLKKLEELSGIASVNAEAALPTPEELAILLESLKKEEGELRAFLSAAQNDPTGPELKAAIIATAARAQRDANQWANGIPKLKERSAALGGEIEAAGRTLQEAEEALENFKKQPRLTLLWTPSTRQKKPLIVVVQGDGAVLHPVDSKETEHLANVAAFRTRLQDFASGDHQVAFYVRPTGTPFFESYKDTAQVLGFATGDDAIPENFILQVKTASEKRP